jgi:hypothetical protein
MEVVALKKTWEASDRMCSHRLQPFLPRLVQVLERHGELAVPPEVKDQLCRMIAATMDRLLRPYHFYQSVMQLQQKNAQGARVHRVYDQAIIPYQRVLDQEVLSVK